MTINTCLYCKKEFIRSRNTKRKYCSHRCYSLDKRELPDKQCIYCKRWFRPVFIKRQFCSPVCFNNSRKGVKRILSIEERKKIGISSRLRNTGLKRTEEQNKHNSEAHKGKHKPWGILVRRDSFFYRKFFRWRKKVVAKNNGFCARCGIQSDSLIADHIKCVAVYPELMEDANNGQMLCKSCNKIKTAEDMKEVWNARYARLKKYI